MIKIRPYARYDGIPTLRDSEIMELYGKMQRDGTNSIVFFDGQIKSANDFLSFVRKPEIILIVALDDDTVVGCGWMSHFENKTARAHFCLFSEGWGDKSLDIGKTMVQTAISITGLEMLIGLIPSVNTRAIEFAVQCGSKLVGEFPAGSVDALGNTYPTSILYYVR